jgi:hypothetical protein
VLGAHPVEAAVEQDGLPDAEQADPVSLVSAEAAVPGEPQEDEPVVPVWSAVSLVDGCSADEHSDSGAVVPEWDPAVCWRKAVAGPVGLRDCPAELSDCPAGQDGSPAEPADYPVQPDAARIHDYCPERLVVAARWAEVPLRIRCRVRLSEVLYRGCFRERLAVELHGCSPTLADFLELRGARHWGDYCCCPEHLDGRFHDCFRLPDGYPELRAVAPPHDHFLLPDDCYLDYQDAARRGCCCPAHPGARSRGCCCRLPDGYPELRAVAPPHDHFPLPDDCCLERRDATQRDCCPVRPVVRHPGYCLARQDAVHPRSDPARCRFHVRLVVEVAPAQGVQREPS